LHRQQPEKDKQNFDFVLRGKISADARADTNALPKPDTKALPKPDTRLYLSLILAAVT